MALAPSEPHWLPSTFMSQIAALHFVLLSDSGPKTNTYARSAQPSAATVNEPPPSSGPSVVTVSS